MLRIEDLKVECVLTRGGFKYEVHAIVGKLVFLSLPDRFNEPGGRFTIEALNNLKFKLKSDLPDYKVDQRIMVRKGGSLLWTGRHFAYFEDGKAACWTGGCTEWTSDGTVTIWDFHRLPTQEELES